MFACDICQKGTRKIAYSRHKKGSSGASGVWALKAPIHKRIQRPNLHSFHGLRLCTKCLRVIKSDVNASKKLGETPASSQL